MSRRTLLLGGSGQVGTALKAALDDVIAPSRSELDLATADLDSVHRLVAEIRPEVVVNCAAYTAVDRAEDETTLAEIVNGRAVGILAEIAARAGIPLVTFSTDYVFDGSADSPYLESSVTNPLNAYGRSKLLGEELALLSNPRTLIIRTSWVISEPIPISFRPCCASPERVERSRWSTTNEAAPLSPITWRWRRSRHCIATPPGSSTSPIRGIPPGFIWQLPRSRPPGSTQPLSIPAPRPSTPPRRPVLHIPSSAPSERQNSA